MPPVRADLLLAEDAAIAGSTRNGPLRFAEPLPVELDLENSGVWEELPGGHRVWRLRIHSPGAKSLALVFSRYQLPVGGELYVYDDRRGTVRGAYTELENRLDGLFAIRPLRGDALTLEYFEPAAGRGRSELALATVAHDYRDVVSLLEGQDRSGGGQSGTCELDVACPLGATWGNQINAAVHVTILTTGFLCSGSLLNNTTNDGTVLLLSSDHCGSLGSALFTFNFQRPACRDGVAPCTNTIMGATQLLRSAELDVQLYRLDVPQGPLPFPAYLAGWDRSDAPPAMTTIIHHPAGDAKKISQDFQPPVKFQNFWRIRDWDRGVTEGGSSGGPMFDTNGRLVGILDSGASACQTPAEDDFATRLAAAWSLLEPYLDPAATGQLTLDGLDLAQVAPRPFRVTGVAPTQVETLVPSTARLVRVLGDGFRDTSQVFLDGLAVDPVLYRRGGHSFINVDLPPAAIGAHVLGVLENGVTESASFTVVPVSDPRLQVGNGFTGEWVFSGLGVDTIHADVPGHVHYCIWSLSNLPSVAPIVSLMLGNSFTDLRSCNIGPIPPEGFVRVHHAIRTPLPFRTRVYNQAVCVSHGVRPLATTNTQETEFRF
jgi:hypothetical protein